MTDTDAHDGIRTPFGIIPMKDIMLMLKPIRERDDKIAELDAEVKRLQKENKILAKYMDIVQKYDDALLADGDTDPRWSELYD